MCVLPGGCVSEAMDVSNTAKTTAKNLEKASEDVEYEVEAILKEKKATGKGRGGKVMSHKSTP